MVSNKNKENKILCICPECKNEFIAFCYPYRKRIFCSIPCKVKSKIYKDKMVKIASEKYVDRIVLEGHKKKGKTLEQLYGKEKANNILNKYRIAASGKSNPNYGNDKIVGKNNPRWIDGRSYSNYPPEFNKSLKRKIFERDNFKCYICGTNKDITVHHRDHIRTNNNERNLLTLCRSHNSKANFINYEI